MALFWWQVTSGAEKGMTGQEEGPCGHVSHTHTPTLMLPRGTTALIHRSFLGFLGPWVSCHQPFRLNTSAWNSTSSVLNHSSLKF